jgi:hypothetical protein
MHATRDGMRGLVDYAAADLRAEENARLDEGCR